VWVLIFSSDDFEICFFELTFMKAWGHPAEGAGPGSVGVTD